MKQPEERPAETPVWKGWKKEGKNPCIFHAESCLQAHSGEEAVFEFGTEVRPFQRKERRKSDSGRRYPQSCPGHIVFDFFRQTCFFYNGEMVDFRNVKRGKIRTQPEKSIKRANVDISKKIKGIL
ncbi:MAG TPA: hypothetical protein H9768_10160 [Candidatus Mailhella merdavium]|nr:hypothetical protein [Candidatus Mailhella merdavium]